MRGAEEKGKKGKKLKYKFRIEKFDEIITIKHFCPFPFPVIYQTIFANI